MHCVLHVAQGDEGQQRLVTSGLVYVSTRTKLAEKAVSLNYEGTAYQ